MQISLEGKRVFITAGADGMGKWAVTGFTQTLAMELGPHNIRVNGVVPGNVSGDRIERVIAAHAETDGLDPEVVRRMYAAGVSMRCSTFRVR